MGDGIRRVDSGDDEVAEAWTRDCDDPDVRGVEVLRWSRGGRWPWQVEVHAAEFVGVEPFESEFRGRIEDAIRSVPGVTDVVEEDREVWLADGNPVGAQLIAAVAAAVDAIAEQIAAAIADEG